MDIVLVTLSRLCKYVHMYANMHKSKGMNETKKRNEIHLLTGI